MGILKRGPFLRVVVLRLGDKSFVTGVMIYFLTEGGKGADEVGRAAADCCVLLDFGTAFSSSNFSFFSGLSSYLIFTALIFSAYLTASSHSELVKGVHLCVSSPVGASG